MAVIHHMNTPQVYYSPRTKASDITTADLQVSKLQISALAETEYMKKKGKTEKK